MKSKLMILILILALISPMALASTIHGTIYDISLTPVSNVITEINTQPLQKQLAKEGSYNFEVNPGSYTISIKTTKGISLSEENITIKDNGDYVLDLFILEDSNELEDIIAKSNQDITASLSPETDYLYYISLAFLLIGIVLLILYFYYKRKVKEEFPKAKEESSKDDLSKIIKIIKNEGNRISQKELRKHFPLSEAKISLMIAELEHRGNLEKIKKGRGNIIILK